VFRSNLGEFKVIHGSHFFTYSVTFLFSVRMESCRYRNGVTSELPKFYLKSLFLGLLGYRSRSLQETYTFLLKAWKGGFLVNDGKWWKTR